MVSCGWENSHWALPLQHLYTHVVFKGLVSTHQNQRGLISAATPALPVSRQCSESHTSLWSVSCSQEAEQKVSYKLSWVFFPLAIAAKCQKSFNLKPEETVIPASSQWNAKLRQVLRMCKCHRDSVLQRSHWHSRDSTAVFCFWFSTNYRQLDIRDLRMQKHTEILHDQLTFPIYKNTASIETALRGQIGGMESEWGERWGGLILMTLLTLCRNLGGLAVALPCQIIRGNVIGTSSSSNVQPLLSDPPAENYLNKNRP